MTIDQWGLDLWKRIKPNQKAAFFSCLIVGYLVHLYAFTNLIPNSDGLSRVYDTQQMTISGRWFLHYASSLNGFTQMPAVIGFLSLFLLGLAAALAVDLLGLRSRLLSGLAGAIMAAFPCMGYTFLYLFTASAYCLSIFLAVLSVWLAKRGRLGWLLGVISLALAMGTYQAYVTVAIALSLLVVFRAALDLTESFSSVLQLGLRLMAYLAAGAALYYGTLMVFLKVKDLELLSYLGIDAVSAGYPFAQLPALLFSTYRQVVAFFFVPGSPNGFSNSWMVALDVLALGIGLLCICRLDRRVWAEPWRPLCALAMLALLPLGINFAQIISPYSVPTPLMKYAFVVVYLAVLLLADQADRPSASLVQRGAALGIPIWAAALLLFCMNTNNLLYTASAQAHQATESYVTRLLTRIQSCPGYEADMEIAVVGAVPADQIRAQIPSYAQVDHYSVPLHTVLALNKHIYYYLNDWLNVPVQEPDEQVMQAISDSSAFQAMPLYPADGSVQILDGRVVVKMQERYTPKSDFEIAYENRR
jgi:hypothetical protein